jgi:hypothetical protein
MSLKVKTRRGASRAELDVLNGDNEVGVPASVLGEQGERDGHERGVLKQLPQILPEGLYRRDRVEA